jgi:hypothetical protein
LLADRAEFVQRRPRGSEAVSGMKGPRRPGDQGAHLPNRISFPGAPFPRRNVGSWLEIEARVGTIRRSNRADVAQLVERVTCNDEVRGSIPRVGSPPNFAATLPPFDSLFDRRWPRLSSVTDRRNPPLGLDFGFTAPNPGDWVFALVSARLGVRFSSSAFAAAPCCSRSCPAGFHARAAPARRPPPRAGRLPRAGYPGALGAPARWPPSADRAAFAGHRPSTHQP